jgi:predicted nucleotidyltransferase
MATPDLNELIERTRASVVSAMPDVVAVYVFGSAATGHHGPESDLDIALLGSRPLPARDLYDLARSLEVELGIDVDLVDLMTASTVLKYEVITRGRRVHCVDPGTVIVFEARCLSEYGRYRDGIAPLLDAVHETGRAYAR